jgi:hypothetical protein
LFNNRIFPVAQNNFRKGKFVEMNIQLFIERIQEALDKELHTVGIFFI